jgi:hypothetical protein
VNSAPSATDAGHASIGAPASATASAGLVSRSALAVLAAFLVSLRRFRPRPLPAPVLLRDRTR